jgi:DNA invertase Pin-like site-specific DNA recombinase
MLRQYCERRAWTASEFIDHIVSGAKERRPALDEMLKAAKRRKFDVVVCWRLDRPGRNLRHLILLLDELHALGVAFVSLAEGIDATTPAGRLQLHVLGAIAEFERAPVQERVRAGLERARAQGRRLGRPERQISHEDVASVRGLPVREAARRLGIPRTTLQRALARIPLESTL